MRLGPQFYLGFNKGPNGLAVCTIHPGTHIDVCTLTGGMIKTIPKKKKFKKAKWLSEEALQMAEKRREVKGNAEKERYIHLNAELQRRAKRDKKAFLSDQCKQIEENH